MEYKKQTSRPRVSPRLIIHGGAGNITPATLPPEKYAAYREALLTIVGKANAYMTTPHGPSSSPTPPLPTSLETATFAVTLLEDNPLFNSGRGSVFTRDGINELEASVMVSHGFAKRGVGVAGLRRVRNPILLARAILEHGDADLGGRAVPSPSGRGEDDAVQGPQLDVPSAQGHTLIHGDAAELLAKRYGLPLVEPEYFFTQTRWDEHVRALERERHGSAGATWSADSYLPQGTVGAVALDEEGVVCAATSTGGMTNKLTGRIGDTPVVGAGFWAGEWEEAGDPSGRGLGGSHAAMSPWDKIRSDIYSQGPVIALSDSLRGLMADCLPTPFTYAPIPQNQRHFRAGVQTTRSMGVSGTGNGDSFMRIAAAHTVAAIARYSRAPSADALRGVTGPGGELQKSAGDRWGRTGEGQGGMIGIECVTVRDAEGDVVEVRGEIIQDFNCGGMFRAWIDDEGRARAGVFREDAAVPERYIGEDLGEGSGQ